MKDSTWNGGVLIGAGVVLGLALGSTVALSIYSVPVWSSQNAPAWVQAIGSIVGIGIAMFLPWKQRRDARADAENMHKIKAVNLAILFASTFTHLKPLLCYQLSQAKPTSSVIERGSDKTIKHLQIQPESKRHYLITLPLNIEELTRDADVFGPPSSNILRCISLIRIINAQVEDSVARGLPINFDQYIRSLERCIELCKFSEGFLWHLARIPEAEPQTAIENDKPR